MSQPRATSSNVPGPGYANLESTYGPASQSIPIPQPYTGQDYLGEDIGSSLLRSTSFASTISGAPSGSSQPITGAFDRTDTSSTNATSVQHDYFGGYPQQRKQQMPPGPDYAATPVGSSSSFANPTAVSGGFSIPTVDRDSYPPAGNNTSEGGRRILEDNRLNDRIIELKHRLGKLEMDGPDPMGDEYDPEGVADDYFDDEEEEDDSRFLNLALLSHIAVRLRDKVPRGTHVKGSIPYPRAFTGKDIVVSFGA